MRRELAEAVFRSNQTYELVLADRLSPGERSALQDLARSPTFYGVLRPRASDGRTVKAVDRGTALLWLTMVEPGPLPAYLARELRERHDEAVRRWVLDGILEMQWDGGFVSGPEALPGLGEGEPGAEDGVLAALSVAALRHGQRARLRDPHELSSRLYRYNRMPLSPEWLALFAGPSAVDADLFGAVGGAARVELERNWLPRGREVGGPGWLLWRSKHARAADPEPVPRFKLYVSPAMGHEREAARAMVRVSDHATHFKVGEDAYGLLRADKMVAYFPGFEELCEGADRILRELEGCPAQGVPFSAELSGEGLLSWGVDPDGERATRRWRGTESWRFWLTNVLASALIEARNAATGSVEPWRFALERVGAEGIDTSTWAPTSGFWRDGSGTGLQ